jgi:hypothetical protein
MFQAFIETSKNGVFATKGILAKEQFENSGIFMPLVLPVRVRHGDLIQVREQRRHQSVGWAIASGRHNGNQKGKIGDPRDALAFVTCYYELSRNSTSGCLL